MVEPTHLQNIRQIGSFPQVAVKITHIGNHHLDQPFMFPGGDPHSHAEMREHEMEFSRLHGQQCTLLQITNLLSQPGGNKTTTKDLLATEKQTPTLTIPRNIKELLAKIYLFSFFTVDGLNIKAQ